MAFSESRDDTVPVQLPNGEIAPTSTNHLLAAGNSL